MVAPASARRKREDGKTFVLVHGAWQSSFCWEQVIPLLVAAGHMVVARDLPSHGLTARFPESYLRRPLDAAAFASEVSPVAGVTLEDYVTDIAISIRYAVEAGSGPVILVGHSPSGIATTAVAERHPAFIANLVYLSAFMPDAGVPAATYITAPENMDGALLLPLLFGDPAKIGALRLDHNSEDPSYFAALQDVFYNDIDTTTFRAVANLLTPDDPSQVGAVPTEKTVARWGRVPRTYIRSLRDRAILPALQNRFIREADAFSPGNPTVVRDLDAGNSAFISQPQALARVLLEIANTTR